MYAPIAALLLLLAQAAPGPPATDLYYLVFLRPDPARRPLAKAEGERIQAAHMANIQDMAKRGVLVAAGPFDDAPTTKSGIFIFKASSLDEARRIAAQDPTVLEHRNTVDVYAWRGPKGIGEEYARLHKENPEMPQGMGVHPVCLIYPGPAWSDRARFVPAHAAYAERLQREGKYAMRGLVEGGGDLAGMVVFQRIPDEEAQRLIDGDPAVKAGVFRVEYHRWWSADHVFPR